MGIAPGANVGSVAGLTGLDCSDVRTPRRYREKRLLMTERSGAAVAVVANVAVVAKNAADYRIATVRRARIAVIAQHFDAGDAGAIDALGLQAQTALCPPGEQWPLTLRPSAPLHWPLLHGNVLLRKLMLPLDFGS